MSGALLLFGYAFLSNVALAVLPHEPAVVWYGAQLGVWPTTLIATGGTVIAALVDHRVFVPMIKRAVVRRRSCGKASGGPAQAAGRGERLFQRFPCATIVLSGLTPLPFFPFKALALVTGYPIAKYAGAVALRCLPRYALLAWLGTAVRLPLWLLVPLSALLMIPSLQLVLCPPRIAS